MPSTYSIIEPHPSVPSTSSYIHAGRGGAGNFYHVQKVDNITNGPNATGPASRTKLAAPASHSYYASGRGGAGNYREKERAIFSFDEELEEQRRIMDQSAPMYHVGRGGAGNFINESTQRKNSSGSTSSSESVRSAARTAKQSLETVGRRFSSPFKRS